MMLLFSEHDSVSMVCAKGLLITQPSLTASATGSIPAVPCWLRHRSCQAAGSAHLGDPAVPVQPCQCAAAIRVEEVTARDLCGHPGSDSPSATHCMQAYQTFGG